MTQTDIHVTEDQKSALQSEKGYIQSDDYVLVKKDVLLNWLGVTPNSVQKMLEQSQQDIEEGRVSYWDVERFLDQSKRTGKT